MLTIAELESFTQSLRSGEFEKEFKAAGSIGRGEMLELLEKIMDAAELADEVATRLIYRGLPLPQKKD